MIRSALGAAAGLQSANMADDRDSKPRKVVSEHSSENLLDAVPLFPLPDVVLFPRAILPLHIFESRHPVMMDDALAGDQQIAMARGSAPGWQTVYRGCPAIHPIVCVGRIVRHEKLEDGRFNLLLEGQTRARIESEIEPSDEPDGKPYRIAHLTPLVESSGMEIDLEQQRARLETLLNLPGIADSSAIKQFRLLLSGPTSTATLADLLAFHALADVLLKQKLLGEVNVAHAVNELIDVLSARWDEPPKQRGANLN